MKIGDRVCFKRRLDRKALTGWQPPVGTVQSLGGGYVVVKWDSGSIMRHDAEVLAVAEPFPYRSHRTMAQVIADEQRPESA